LNKNKKINKQKKKKFTQSLEEMYFHFLNSKLMIQELVGYLIDFEYIHLIYFGSEKKKKKKKKLKFKLKKKKKKKGI